MADAADRKRERAEARASAQFKPYQAPRLPRLSDDQVAAVIRRGWTKEDGTELTEEEVSWAVSGFHRWRQWDGLDGHFRPIVRKQPFAPNAHRLHRYLYWVKLWSPRVESLADSKPVRVDRPRAPAFALTAAPADPAPRLF